MQTMDASLAQLVRAGKITRQLGDASACVIGPGLGRDRSTWRLVVDLAVHAECPMVIDADGLNALAESPRTTCWKSGRASR